MPKPQISWQTTPTDKIIWDSPSILLPMFSLDRCLCSCNGTSAGYESYGDSIIGLAGCGPTCLSMVYVYFTHDLNGTPREIASYCEKNGYYTENGTSWSLWTEGLPALGLSGKELPLGENSMKTALDQGKLIVCSMRPGDFTTSGHYILLYDYDDTGFCVKDPNRVSNSSRTWDYDTLSPQIKNLWTISPTGF